MNKVEVLKQRTVQQVSVCFKTPVHLKHHEVHVCRRCNINLLLLKREFYDAWICGSCKTKEELSRQLPQLEVKGAPEFVSEDIVDIESHPPVVPMQILENLRSGDDHIGQVDDEIAIALVDIEQMEIANITVKARVADHEYQTIEATLVSALSSLASISNQIAALANEMPKDMVPSLLKEALDTAHLVGNQIQDLNNKRRLEVRSYLSSHCVGIGTAKIAQSEYLFGSDLAETLKSTEVTN
ncbi:unnamed protein product [Orchesella dallaii]|uniref:Uncharacterized protein n=1 Tax=Orchesella dallaii TaxID=48710 RepID=A0ABP1RQI8_9HEXA